MEGGGGIQEEVRRKMEGGGVGGKEWRVEGREGREMREGGLQILTNNFKRGSIRLGALLLPDSSSST